MRAEKTSFLSDGLKLDASFFHPDENVDTKDKPFVIVCSGFQGLKNIHPERYARWLTQYGYTCFGFDYRGFARSEGEPTVCHLEDQIRDISNAVAFVRHRMGDRNRKLVLAGWGMGGGLILDAARISQGVDALVAINGFYNAKRVQTALRTEKEWNEFQDWYHEEKTRLATGGEPRSIDPFHIYPLDPETKVYVDNVLRKNPDFGINVRLSFADSLLQFAPENSLEHLKETPLLIVHGDRNALHPVAEAKSLHECYPGPKEMYWVPDAGHTEWMLDENPKFQAVARRIGQWIATRS
jgi:pimeloyl-ACP methyl ester carboxylesterase